MQKKTIILTYLMNLVSFIVLFSRNRISTCVGFVIHIKSYRSYVTKKKSIRERFFLLENFVFFPNSYEVFATTFLCNKFDIVKELFAAPFNMVYCSGLDRLVESRLIRATCNMPKYPDPRMHGCFDFCTVVIPRYHYYQRGTSHFKAPHATCDIKSVYYRFSPTL